MSLPEAPARQWVGDWTADPGDGEILAYAARNAQVVVTLDKDFGELAVALAAAHAGIVRLVDFRYVDQAPACIRAIAAHGAELARGAIVTTERRGLACARRTRNRVTYME